VEAVELVAVGISCPLTEKAAPFVSSLQGRFFHWG
jgi:hypothetical protein